jgi:protein-tyrosine-phosphatase/DNA-binding transcriptional ArsR family regulator
VAQAPRRLGRPLDLEAAQSRALQIVALADPVRLQILSVIATAAEGERNLSAILSAVGIPHLDLTSHIGVLAGAGLVTLDDGHEYQLTADSWVRFGRLLSDTTALNQAPRPVSVPSVVLPPVAARIAADLAYRFSAYFSPETVAKYVGESYSLLSERANIRSFLPSLTTRFATDRLSALATAQGLVLRGTPEVLFVCVQNAGRSQMAAAMLRQLAGDRVHVRTAGSAPAASVHQSVIDALDEIGVPLASEFPKPLTDEVVQAADFVITMGCGDACPIYPGRRYMDWPIDDPVGLPMSEVRRVRDDIFVRVQGLLDDMN